MEKLLSIPGNNFTFIQSRVDMSSNQPVIGFIARICELAGSEGLASYFFLTCEANDQRHHLEIWWTLSPAYHYKFDLTGAKAALVPDYWPVGNDIHNKIIGF
jgi:hypothetical protein